MLAIDDIELARALHVLAVAHWIGGVSFVTLVALPLARATGDPKRGWALFESIERRFAAQVRISILIANLTELWMTWRLDLWSAFREPVFWWMDAMVMVWTLFVVIVFIVEPLAHKRIGLLATREPVGLLTRLFRAHLLLLAVGAITILAPVAGVHGGLFR